MAPSEERAVLEAKVLAAAKELLKKTKRFETERHGVTFARYSYFDTKARLLLEAVHNLVQAEQ